VVIMLFPFLSILEHSRAAIALDEKNAAALIIAPNAGIAAPRFGPFAAQPDSEQFRSRPRTLKATLGHAASWPTMVMPAICADGPIGNPTDGALGARKSWRIASCQPATECKSEMPLPRVPHFASSALKPH